MTAGSSNGNGMALVVSSSIEGPVATTATDTSPSPTRQRKYRTGDPKDRKQGGGGGGGDVPNDGTTGQGHAKDMKTKTKRVMTMKPGGYKFPPLLNESPIDWLYGDNMAEFANSKTYTK